MVYENVYSAFISDDRELTGPMLIKLAKHVSREIDVLTLAVIGLGMKENDVKHHLKCRDHDGEIHMAMYNILVEWRKTQPNNRTAYINLGQALVHEDVNMGLLAAEDLDGVPEDFVSGRAP